jgi:hypothetical protein
MIKQKISYVLIVYSKELGNFLNEINQKRPLSHKLSMPPSLSTGALAPVEWSHELLTISGSITLHWRFSASGVVPYNVSLFIVLLFTSWVSKILDLSEY